MKAVLKFTCYFLLFIACDKVAGLLINIGLDNYFGLNRSSEILLIGHSHLMLATDKIAMEKALGVGISKYCREGVNTIDRYQMVKQYIESPFADSLKVVLYGVDQFMFIGKGLSVNSYKLFYPFMDNDIMDDYIRKSTNAKDYWFHKLIHTSRYSDALLNSSIRGWLNNWDNYKYGNLNVEKLSQEIEEDNQRHIGFENDLVSAFEQTIEMLIDKGIRIVLINTPIAKLLNDYEPDSYNEIINYFQQKADSSSLIDYWDFNPQYSADYDIFFDPIHLNPLGQKIINEQIIEKIQSEL